MPEAETQPSYQGLLFYPYGYGAFFFIRAGFEYYLTQLSQDHFKNEQIKNMRKTPSSQEIVRSIQRE